LIFPLYTLGIRIFGLVLWLTSPVSKRAKNWIALRRNQDLTPPSHKSSSIWFHVSSLGEFEQALPIIKAYKALNEKIVVTFFSDSGYNNRPTNELIDEFFLFPLDTRTKANKLIDKIQPKLVIWNKNDFWFNTINVLVRRSIPIVFNAVALRESHILLNPFTYRFRKLLRRANRIFTIDRQSFDLLKIKKFDNIEFGGDTRIERVKNRKLHSSQIESIGQFKGKNKLILFGSIHKEDLKLISNCILQNPDFKYLIVPHEVDQKSVGSIMNELKVEFDLFEPTLEKYDGNILVINKIGILFDAYKYADLIYVGGGFGKGIHNILEPTVFGKTVCIGPRYNKFWEAKLFISKGWIELIPNAETFADKAKQYLSSSKDAKVKLDELEKFYDQYPSATNKIVEYCKSII